MDLLALDCISNLIKDMTAPPPFFLALLLVSVVCGSTKQLCPKGGCTYWTVLSLSPPPSHSHNLMLIHIHTFPLHMLISVNQRAVLYWCAKVRAAAGYAHRATTSARLLAMTAQLSGPEHRPAPATPAAVGAIKGCSARQVCTKHWSGIMCSEGAVCMSTAMPTVPTLHVLMWLR